MILGAALALAWIGCFVALNILLKRGVSEVSLDAGIGALVRQLLASPSLYFAAVLYAACAAFYVAALRVMPLSTAGPIYMTLGVIAAACTGVLYFSEPLTAPKIAGLALCIAGIGLLASSGGTS